MVDIMRVGVADQRDEIIFGEVFNRKKYGGGLRRFDDLTLEQIDKLEELGVLDMEEAQNYSPNTGEIIDFLREHKTDGWYVHGYCISPERSDFRITFEGVGKKTPPSKDELIDFTNMFRGADEFNVDKEGMYCWYD